MHTGIIINASLTKYKKNVYEKQNKKLVSQNTKILNNKRIQTGFYRGEYNSGMDFNIRSTVD